MPSLKEVIDQFKNSFQYIDSENQRKTLWYEFWFTDFIKEKCTNTKLTKTLEQTAKKCSEELDELSALHADGSFESHQNDFFKIIFDALGEVQKQRYRSGKIKTEHSQQGPHSIMERTLYPKKEGLFEGMFIKGLNSVQETFPELSPIMDLKMRQVKEATPGPFVLFHESMTINGNGQKFFSTDGRTRTIHDVDEAVDKNLKCV